MLRPRGPVDPEPEHLVRRRPRRDPLASLNVAVLVVIALALFAAAILAVYTYSTPAVEAPLVVAIAIAFAALLAVNVVGLTLRQLRAGRW